MIFQSDRWERANTFWHAENHEPTEASAARGVRTYLKKQAVPLVLSINGGEPVLVLSRDVDLVACQRVAHLAKLLDLGLENFFQTLVLQFCTFHLLLQLCVREGNGYILICHQHRALVLYLQCYPN